MDGVNTCFARASHAYVRVIEKDHLLRADIQARTGKGVDTRRRSVTGPVSEDQRAGKAQPGERKARAGASC